MPSWLSAMTIIIIVIPLIHALQQRTIETMQ